MALTEQQRRRLEQLKKNQQERLQGNAPKTGFQKFDEKAMAIQERVSPERESSRISKILQKGFGGIKKAYQHPVTQNVAQKSWSGVKTTAAAGAGLMGGLAVGTYKGVKAAHEKTGGVFILIFPILLWYFDYISGINGIQFQSVFASAGFDFFYKFLATTPFLLLLGLYFIIRRPSSREEIIYGSILIFLFVLVWTFGRGNPWVFVHLLFAIIVYIILLKGLDANESIDSRHFLFLFVVIWDIFVFPSFEFLNSSTVESGVIDVIANKLLFPIWLFYFFTFIKDTPSKKFLLASIWIFYMGLLGWQFYNDQDFRSSIVFLSEEQRQEAISSPQKVAKNYADLFRNWFRGRVQYAITGKVEQNQYEQLGVYLENVKASSQRYYENEPIYIWGTVKTRTLDEPVNVKVGCYLSKGFNTKTQANKVDPENKFSVFTLEEQDFACTFDGFKSGSKTVYSFADFNFETLTYLKVYFMDRDRLRATTRENVDVFQQFNIKDKNPESVSTNGPIQFGMKTTSPLVGVSNDYTAFPRIRFSLQSRPGWEGRLKDLKEVVLLLPKGAEITNPETDCNEKFQQYDRSTCESKSCQNIINECKETCSGFKENQQGKNKCESLCDRELTECQQECSNLFFEESEEYNGYSLDVESLKAKYKITSPEDIGKLTFFDCSFNPKPSEILGNSPITTKTFRAKARYDYTVEKSLTVSVSSIPDLLDRGIGDVAVTGNTDMEKRIIQISNEIGIDPVIVRSVAKIESGFKHCADGTLNCGTLNKENVNCNAYGSCGIMQINKAPGANPQLFEAGIAQKYGCGPEETAYDLDCNIRSGIGILMENYNANANNDDGYLNKISICKNPVYNEKYSRYKGWDRAVRLYNGPGCVPPPQGRADVNYVEKVNEFISGYRVLKIG